MKVNKFFLVCLLFVSMLFANNNREIYNTAIEYYNDERYDIAEPILKDLEKKGYPDTIIYFVLGKIYRFKDDNITAIRYFKKYLENPSSKKNEMYAKINLAYEYLELKTKESLDKAMKIVDELIESEYKSLGDVTYCFAMVYNSIGFYFLKNDMEVEGNLEYYQKTAGYFKKSLKQRKELVGVANNLAISYIRIIEILEKEKLNNMEEIKDYAKKANDILSDDSYKHFTNGKFQKTKEYFNKNYKKYLNTN